jgi:hypothetical protein
MNSRTPALSMLAQEQTPPSPPTPTSYDQQSRAWAGLVNRLSEPHLSSTNPPALWLPPPSFAAPPAQPSSQPDRSSFCTNPSIPATSHSYIAQSERAQSLTMARVYADVNQQMPRAYWDYDSVNISWGVLENYEVVRKIGISFWETRTLHRDEL